MSQDGINRPADLLAAVAACRNSFGKPVSVKPTIRDFIWKFRMDRNKSLFKRELVKFSKWMSCGSSGPRFWEIIMGGQNTRDLTGPQVLTLIVPLMMKTGMSETEVMNMGLGRAQWVSAEVAEIEGSDRRFLFDQDLQDDFADEESEDNEGGQDA